MIPILILIGIVVATYLPTIKFSVIVDDIKHYEKIQKGLFGTLKDNFRLGNLISRLYGGGTFYTNKYKHNTEIDHAFTIFLHAVVCVLIYLALGKNEISFWAAALYSVNNVNNQTSIWLNGRRYCMSIIFVFEREFCSFHFRRAALKAAEKEKGYYCYKKGKYP